MNLWTKLKQHKPSPLVELEVDAWQEKELKVYVKRDDLLSPLPHDPFCGNKWRKLKYNLLYAQAQGIDTLLSFGGAYSNHIAALASAGRQFGFKTIGIIRGEEVENHTLRQARKDGMLLSFIDRATYRRKKEANFLADLQATYPNAYIIPEGGTNALALEGCKELAEEIQTQVAATHICSACGTGGTLAGMIQGLGQGVKALGISVLKGDFMRAEVETHLEQFTKKTYNNWEVLEGYHHGGYAKKTQALLDFIDAFYGQHAIQLEPIYTAKLFYAIDQLIKEDYFPRGSKIVMLHSGGLQGIIPEV